MFQPLRFLGRFPLWIKGSLLTQSRQMLTNVGHSVSVCGSSCFGVSPHLWQQSVVFFGHLSVSEVDPIGERNHSDLPSSWIHLCPRRGTEMSKENKAKRGHTQGFSHFSLAIPIPKYLYIFIFIYHNDMALWNEATQDDVFISVDLSLSVSDDCHLLVWTVYAM